jgi:ribonuclease HI
LAPGAPLDQADAQQQAHILLLLWRAWHLRNDIVHQEGRATIGDSVLFLQAYCSAGVETDKEKSGVAYASPSEQTVQRQHWKAPPPGWIKVNTDGSFNIANPPGFARAVARDHTGKVIFVASKILQGCEDAEEAEARAALFGVSLAKNFDHQQLILESDITSTVIALCTKGRDRSPNWLTIDDTKAVLESLREHRVVHVRREGNKVADALAKLQTTEDFIFYESSAPSNIREIVLCDLNLASVP